MDKELVVKPVLTYSTPQRREAWSWREWGGIQTEAQAIEEAGRIQGELSSIRTDFNLRVLPLSRVKRAEDVSSIDFDQADVLLIYGAGGSLELLDSLISKKRWNILFLRHQSGPFYLWYEIAHPTLLRKRVSDEPLESNISLDDVVVDSYEVLTKKLRALHGLKNTLGKRIVAIGGPSGWGIGAKAVERAKERWGLDIVTIPYEPDLAQRIAKKRGDPSAVEGARKKAQEYLSAGGVELKTAQEFVVNSFLLYDVFEELMKDNDADAITINDCMTTIMPMAHTTACLPLSLINDEGKLAFCESDFVVIPAGVLLHHISGKPVFLNDPTFPHDGIVTVAHDTAPRLMSGKKPADVKLFTHYESDYGAAPQVLFEKGQELTVVDPDFEEKIWVGFRGKVLKPSDYPICHSQMDIEIEGDWQKLVKEMRGFHWMISYGDYLEELEYALAKVGIEFRRI